MTCELTRPVTRKTTCSDAGRRIIVQLEQGGKLIKFRLARCREWYHLPIESAYTAAVKIRVQQKRAQRAAERKRGAK